MKKLWLCAVMALCVCAGCQRKVWRTFSSKQGKFSVRMPGKVETVTHSRKTKVGLLKVHMFLAQQEHRVFMVAYTDYPLNFIKGTRAETILDDVILGALRRFEKPKILQKKTIQRGVVSGMEFQAQGFQKKKKFLYTSRVYLRKNRLYQAAAMHQTTKDKPLIQKYLSSFQIELHKKNKK